MRIHILPDGCTDFIFTLGEWLMLLKKESDYATLSFLFCRTYDKIFGTRHLYRIDSHVWRSFFTLWFVLLYKPASTRNL